MFHLPIAEAIQAKFGSFGFAGLRSASITPAMKISPKK